MEHAVPLRLIHNRILGVTANGIDDPQTRDLFDSEEAIEDFVARFVVGVQVAAGEHRRLNAQFMSTMPEGWAWTTEAVGSSGLMGRYHSIGIRHHARGGCERCMVARA